eukprot:1030809-Alexandrium_andersonii.AAC.3
MNGGCLKPIIWVMHVQLWGWRGLSVRRSLKDAPQHLLELLLLADVLEARARCEALAHRVPKACEVVHARCTDNFLSGGPGRDTMRAQPCSNCLQVMVRPRVLLEIDDLDACRGVDTELRQGSRQSCTSASNAANAPLRLACGGKPTAWKTSRKIIVHIMATTQRQDRTPSISVVHEFAACAVRFRADLEVPDIVAVLWCGPGGI